SLLGVGEGVPESPSEILQGPGAAVDREIGSLAKVVDPQVVQSHDMIRVTVGVQDGIEVIDPMPEGLLSEVAGGVHQNLARVPFQKNGGTEPPIAGIVGNADATTATDDRHAGRGPGSQKSDFHAWSPRRRRSPSGEEAAGSGRRQV